MYFFKMSLTAFKLLCMTFVLHDRAKVRCCHIELNIKFGNTLVILFTASRATARWQWGVWVARLHHPIPPRQTTVHRQHSQWHRVVMGTETVWPEIREAQESCGCTTGEELVSWWQFLWTVWRSDSNIMFVMCEIDYFRAIQEDQLATLSLRPKDHQVLE